MALPSLPPGMDYASAADVVALLRDVVDRSKAPRRLKGRTQYVYERELRLGSAGGGVCAEVERYYPGVARAGEEDGVARVGRYARDFFRRDKMTAICADMKVLQDDVVAEETLTGTRRLEGMIENMQEIPKCQNRDRAKRLRECAHVCLQGVPSDWETRPIYDRKGGAPPTPIWGVSPPKCRIDSTEAVGGERLGVLRATAIALATAHRQDWPHRRLSVYQIVIVDKQHGSEGTGQSTASVASTMSESLPGQTKVLRFFSTRYGCHGVGGAENNCQHHRDRLAYHRRGEGFDLFESERRDGDYALFLDDQEAALDDGKRHDVRSFARLLLWIYSGTFLPDKRPLKIDSFLEEAGEVEDERREARREIDNALSRVPWPLRFILFESERLSMDNIALFLDALGSDLAKPHDSEYLPTPPKGIDASSKDQVLRELCTRSAEVGMLTDEPQAAMHMGRFWEDIAEREASKRAKALTEATRCYSLAFRLGEQDGMLKLAKLKCDRLAGDMEATERSKELRAMLRILLEVGALGKIEARIALHGFAEHGLETAAAFLDKDQPRPHYDPYEYDSEFSFMRGITKIGKLHRRGRCATMWRVEPDLDEARHWLMIASERAHPEAILELGLLGVQQAKSVETMRESVDLVKKAANTQVCPNACFWLSFWYKNPQFLSFALEQQSAAIQQPPSDAVLDENPRQAISYALLGVKADHSDCIDLYAEMIRTGYAALPTGKSKSEVLKDLNSRARRSVEEVNGKYCCRASFSEADQMLDRAGKAAKQWGDQDLPTPAAAAEIFDNFAIAIEIMVGFRGIPLQKKREMRKLGPPPFDPFPLIVAATEIRGRPDDDVAIPRDLLTRCKFDRRLSEKKKKAFHADLDKLVADLCRRARSYYDDENLQYREVRVDWLAWDREWLPYLEALERGERSPI